MQITPQEVHIWSTELSLIPDQAEKKLTILSQDEHDRALRFRFATHRNRYIASRSILRQILGLYLQVDPKVISFSYSVHKKPHVLHPSTLLQFNMSHSNNMATFAFTHEHAIGVDIEKEQSVYKQNVAERFFSPQENAELAQLSEQERISGFYRVWARKEALIKAVGKGLTIPLNRFSVSASNASEIIELENEFWHLIPLAFWPGYQSAVASNQIIKKISHWLITEQSPKLEVCYTVDSPKK